MNGSVSIPTVSTLSVGLATIHDRAVAAADGFKRSEAELMEALISVASEKVHLRLGYPSLFQYAVTALGLSEAVAYNAVAVSRKAVEVAALRNAVASGSLGFSKARKVLSVLSPRRPVEEQVAWVEKAVLLSSRNLERAVARENPAEAISERAIYRSALRIELSLGVSETLLLDLRQVQNLVSSARGTSASLEDTLRAMVELYLARKDPERKARRVIAKKGMAEDGSHRNDLNRRSGTMGGNKAPVTEIDTSVRSEKNPSIGDTQNRDSLVPKSDAGSGKGLSMNASAMSGDERFTGTVQVRRKPLPAALLHAVRFRDRNTCQFEFVDGKKCGSKRWLEIHHRIPVNQGGANRLANLVTLCRAHHRALHQNLGVSVLISEKREGRPVT